MDLGKQLKDLQTTIYSPKYCFYIDHSLTWKRHALAINSKFAYWTCWMSLKTQRTTYYNGVNNGFCSILLPFIYSKQWRASCSRGAYYSNSIASFQLLLIADDIHPQPGPLANHDQKPRVLTRNALLMGMANVRSLRNKTSDFVDYVCSTK